MTEPSGPHRRIADTIRPAMMEGLHGATLHGSDGAQHIAAWVDWIAEAVTVHVVQPIADERDAFADRVDTLSHVAQNHKKAYSAAARDVQRLEARVAELEAEVEQLREASPDSPGS
ncbi:hypothetical protein [Kitasatospora sp. NBC_01539]|uniref:hypothetical protein n=1 Tax=Kitasatospora sp. NBC_01539 TaxID=2903577 RepID=UPI003860205B